MPEAQVILFRNSASFDTVRSNSDPARRSGGPTTVFAARTTATNGTHLATPFNGASIPIAAGGRGREVEALSFRFFIKKLAHRAGSDPAAPSYE